MNKLEIRLLNAMVAAYNRALEDVCQMIEDEGLYDDDGCNTGFIASKVENLKIKD